MKVINTYIVNYSKSYAPNDLAILFELENGTYIIKYQRYSCEIIEPIDTKIGVSLIKIYST
jgi:hypothetical protein